MLSIALALVVNVATSTIVLPRSGFWVHCAVWSAVAVLAAASVWAVRARRRPSSSVPGEDVLVDLAARLDGDWSAEAVRREVTRPAPVSVAWSSTGRPGLAAGRAAVLGDGYGGDWQEFPLRGQTDRVNEQIVAAFRSLPRRQLVVLGEPGAGKSVFGLLLTLGLIRGRAADDELPLLLAINAWDPAVPVGTFVSQRLAEDYKDVLARFGDPEEVADGLVAHRRIMPVLDGLDELPDEAIGPALKALDDYAAAGRPLVVTCRIREYARVVARTETILTTAAVVELEPVGTGAAIEYLSYPEPARARWAPVFAHLRSSAGADPLTQALSTPLMVSLARVAYQTPEAKPAELLELPTRTAVSARLMDAFVTGAYGGSERPRLDPIRARRWLSCLAYQAYQAGTRDLCWWRIRPGLLSAGRPFVAPLLTAVTAVVLAGLIAGLAGLAAGVGTALWCAATGFAAMIIAGDGSLKPLLAGGAAPDQRWAAAFRRRHGQRAALALGYGLGGAVAVGGITTDWATAAPAGLVVALLTAVVPAFVTVAVRQAVIADVVFTVAGVLTRAPYPWAVGLIAAVVYGGTAGLVAGGWDWTQFRLTHLRLVAGGWLPWRLRRFVADAHRRGVLRRAGSVYQFRHAILQDHLAEGPRVIHLQHQVDAAVFRAAQRLEDFFAERGRVDELRARADAGSRSAAERLPGLLVELGRIDEAIGFLRSRADAGDRDSAAELDRLLAKLGRVDELRARADNGSALAAELLAGLLAKEGSVDEAIEVLRARTAAGDELAVLPLAALLAKHGQPDEAIDLLQAGSATDNGDTAELLASVLAKQGRVDEAIEVLQKRSQTGDRSTWRLTELLAAHGRIEDLRRLAETGDEAAGWQLAYVLEEGDRIEEAIDVLRVTAKAGSRIANKRLAELLHERGRTDEAVEILRAAARAGDGFAAWRLADLLAGCGRLDELAARAGANDEPAIWRLADALAEQGRGEEAFGLVRSKIEAGSLSGATRLAEMHVKLGRDDEAIDILRSRVDDGDWSAAYRLAELLAGQGRVDEAITMLRVQVAANQPGAGFRLDLLLAEHGRVEELTARADAGNAHAGVELLDLLARQGQVDALRARAEAGSRAAAWRLIDVLAEQGRTDEAMEFLRPRIAAEDPDAAQQWARLTARHTQR